MLLQQLPISSVIALMTMVMVMVHLIRPSLAYTAAASDHYHRYGYRNGQDYSSSTTSTTTTTTTTTTTPVPTTSSPHQQQQFKGSFVAGRAKCVGCFASKLGCDWPAAHVANLPSIPTLTPKDDAGCASLCLVNTQCTHYTFSFMAPDGLGFCFLKSSSNSSSRATPTVALAPFNAPGSTCGWMFGRSAQVPLITQ